MQNDAETVSIVIVNRNTIEHLSHLLFSIYRVLNRASLDRILVVDNASSDGSRELLTELQARSQAVPVELVLNRAPLRHGPSLNQAIDLLLAKRAISSESQPAGRYVLVLDSDAIVLQGELAVAMTSRLQAASAGLAGQFQYDALAEGYAHPCCLMLDLNRIGDLPHARFDDSGAPATRLHEELRRSQIPIVDIPVLSDHFALHVGRGTRRVRDHRTNGDSDADWKPHFHAIPEGPSIYEQFLQAYQRHLGGSDTDSLIKACLQNATIETTWLPAVVTT